MAAQAAEVTEADQVAEGFVRYANVAPRSEFWSAKRELEDDDDSYWGPWLVPHRVVASRGLQKNMDLRYSDRGIVSISPMVDAIFFPPDRSAPANLAITAVDTTPTADPLCALINIGNAYLIPCTAPKPGIFYVATLDVDGRMQVFRYEDADVGNPTATRCSDSLPMPANIDVPWTRDLAVHSVGEAGGGEQVIYWYNEGATVTVHYRDVVTRIPSYSLTYGPGYPEACVAVNGRPFYCCVYDMMADGLRVYAIDGTPTSWLVKPRPLPSTFRLVNLSASEYGLLCWWTNDSSVSRNPPENYLLNVDLGTNRVLAQRIAGTTEPSWYRAYCTHGQIILASYDLIRGRVVLELVDMRRKDINPERIWERRLSPEDEAEFKELARSWGVGRSSYTMEGPREARRRVETIPPGIAETQMRRIGLAGLSPAVFIRLLWLAFRGYDWRRMTLVRVPPAREPEPEERAPLGVAAAFTMYELPDGRGSCRIPPHLI